MALPQLGGTSPTPSRLQVPKILGSFLYSNPLLTPEKAWQRLITAYKLSTLVPRISFLKRIISDLIRGKEIQLRKQNNLSAHSSLGPQNPFKTFFWLGPPDILMTTQSKQALHCETDTGLGAKSLVLNNVNDFRGLQLDSWNSVELSEQ